MKAFAILVTIAASLFVSGCAGILSPAQQPVQNNTQPEVINTTIVENVTITVVSPLFDYNIPRFGNATFYIPNAIGETLFVLGSENETILLDTGSADDLKMLVKLLRNLGVSRIDALVLTRNSPDTSGNIAALNSFFEIGKVYHNGISAFQEPLQGLQGIFAEEAIPLDTTKQVGKFLLSFSVPYDDSEGYSQNPDDNAMVVKLTYGSASVLYAPLCTLTCEGKVTNNNLNSGILIVGKRSCEATTLYFLGRVKPLAVAGIGELCDEVNKRLLALDIKAYSTTKDGGLAFTTDGSKTFLVGGEVS